MQNRIKERIKESGMMQKDIAEKLEITTVGLSQIVNAKMPKLETFVKIAEVLNIPAWKMILTEEELEEIRTEGKSTDENSNQFQCPVCGASLKVVPNDEAQPQD